MTEKSAHIQCPCCKRQWADGDGFLDDPWIELVAYQVHFEELEEGFFLFNHDHPECGTTLALPVRQFKKLHAGPVFSKRKGPTGRCDEHCLHSDDLRPCPQACECSWVRETVQIIKKRKTRATKPECR